MYSLTAPSRRVNPPDTLSRSTLGGFNACTDFSYYRARYYDPATGRFLNEDPIGFEGGNNFYSYVLNRPVIYTDPEGEIPLPLVTAGIGAIAGGLGDRP